MDRLRVLHVGDAERDTVRISNFLERAGYEVSIQRVETELEVQQAYANPEWDVIACDWDLSQLRAREVLRLLRATGLEAPFVIVYRNIDVQSAVEMVQLGAQDCVMKGDLTRLAPAIERGLQERARLKRRKEADERLRNNDERLRLALAAANIGVWEWDLASNSLYWSSDCCKIAGIHDFDGRLDSFLEIVHPEDVRQFWTAVEEATTGAGVFAAEYRIGSGDETRWLAQFGSVRRNAQGRPASLIGTMQDITDRRAMAAAMQQTNEELEQLANNYRSLLGLLHSIREDERARLSREIHDLLGQSLTNLKINALAEEQALERGQIEIALDRLGASNAEVDRLMQAVRDIATELRPPMLDQFGLAAALEWQAELLREQHALDVEVELPAAEPELNELQRISAFRIAQEALTNVVRHAGTKSARISLSDDATSVRLVIEDMGTGFEPDERVHSSLGIFGMRERARLIGAMFSIRRNIRQGTTVELIIQKGTR